MTPIRRRRRRDLTTEEVAAIRASRASEAAGGITSEDSERMSARSEVESSSTIHDVDGETVAMRPEPTLKDRFLGSSEQIRLAMTDLSKLMSEIALDNRRLLNERTELIAERDALKTENNKLREELDLLKGIKEIDLPADLKDLGGDW